MEETERRRWEKARSRGIGGGSGSGLGLEEAVWEGWEWATGMYYVFK